MKSVLLACLVVPLSAQLVHAGRVHNTLPIHARMWTYVGEKPPDIPTEFSWIVGFEKQRYQLHITKMIVLTGTSLPQTIDAAVRRYPIQFQLIGEKGAVQQFLAAPPGQLMQMSGYLRIDGVSRYLMLDRVQSAPTTTPARQ